MSELISVLMCVYNTPTEYLKEAVDSILNQSYESLEFIIVNDCSSDDNVLEYLRNVSRSDSRICIVNNSENLGLTKSLNIGLEHCRGKYIARMDSDDISLPDRIKKQVDYMKLHPEVALVGSNIICFGEGIIETDSSNAYNPCDDPEIYQIRSLLEHSGPPHPTFMLRSGFLEANGIRYREDILKAQDYGLMADILKSGGIIRKLPEPLLRYRIHKGQITTNSEVEQKLYQLRVSFDYIRTIFNELSEEECLSISLLGCKFEVNDIKECIDNNQSLKNCFAGIDKLLQQLTKPSIYICAQKKLIMICNKTNQFNVYKLKAELGYDWWKRALHSYSYYGISWLLNPYTLLSYRYVIKRKFRK